VTKKAGLDPSQHGIGCTAGDYDNDGAVDLAVSTRAGLILLHNEKNGTFKDVTLAAGIKSDGTSAGVTFIDYDHDGDLDLYVSRQDPRELASNPPTAANPQPAQRPSTTWSRPRAKSSRRSRTKSKWRWAPAKQFAIAVEGEPSSREQGIRPENFEDVAQTC